VPLPNRLRINNPGLAGPENAPLIQFARFAVRDRERRGQYHAVRPVTYQNGAVRIIALNSNPQLRVDELGRRIFGRMSGSKNPST
jgi:hypothetical protein